MRVRHPELVLAAATLVSTPMLPELLNGGINPLSALVRFLIALVACWIAGSILSRLIIAYTNQARRAAIAKQVDQENERRRAMAEEALRQRAGSATGANGQNGITGSNGVNGVNANGSNGSNAVAGNGANGAGSSAGNGPGSSSVPDRNKRPSG
ncbi:MAG: hypothetical protein ACYDGY_02635 [Acidimicrobiales bacterium]